MTDTAHLATRTVDDRVASARGFFDTDSTFGTTAAVGTSLPPPRPEFATATIPVAPVPSIPQLPRVAPPKPATSTPFEFSASTPYMPAPPTSTTKAKGKKRSGGGGRRFVSWMVVLGIVGGGIYAGLTYGPDLLDRGQDDPTADEPAAPLVFPTVVPPLTPMRTATFLVEQQHDDGTAISYELTNDFETGVSRMLIDRGSADIEVLAVFDVANLRLADQPNWYSTPRGIFPFPAGSEAQSWLRTIDEYFPVSVRSFVTIDAASESTLGTEAVRHLVVTVDAAALASAASVPPAPLIDPATGQALPTPPPTPGAFVPPTSVSGNSQTIEPVTLEIWVDANGMIRKLAEPPSMGGRTITVTSLSSDPFSPTFPAPEVVTPLTAEQLVDFTS
jgi:hypothetical protein